MCVVRLLFFVMLFFLVICVVRRFLFSLFGFSFCYISSSPICHFIINLFFNFLGRQQPGHRGAPPVPDQGAAASSAAGHVFRRKASGQMITRAQFRAHGAHEPNTEHDFPGGDPARICPPILRQCQNIIRKAHLDSH